FFFSSRRRHTRFSRDWSSDVCSSDLIIVRPFLSLRSKYIKRVLENVFGRNLPSHLVEINIQGGDPKVSDFQRRFGHHFLNFLGGSEERRVGKECRSGWSQREAENRER